MDADTALWRCPRCGAGYVTPNMWHSCNRMDPEQWLAERGERAMTLWIRLVEIIASFGPYELHATKTRISFMVLVRFAGVSALSDRGMSLNFWLKHEERSPRFAKVEHLGHSDWIYRVRIREVDELDDEIVAWLHKAYAVGCRRVDAQHPSEV